MLDGQMLEAKEGKPPRRHNATYRHDDPPDGLHGRLDLGHGALDDAKELLALGLILGYFVVEGVDLLGQVGDAGVDVGDGAHGVGVLFVLFEDSFFAFGNTSKDR